MTAQLPHAEHGHPQQGFEDFDLPYLNTRTDIQLVQLIDTDDVDADGSMSWVPPQDRPCGFAVADATRTFADLLTATGAREAAHRAGTLGSPAPPSAEEKLPPW